MMLLSMGSTPDGLTRSFLEPIGLPPIQTGGVPFMHPVRKAFGCAGCVRGVGVSGLGLDFSTMTTVQKLGLLALVGAAGYGGWRFMKKHRRRRRR